MNVFSDAALAGSAHSGPVVAGDRSLAVPYSLAFSGT